MHRRILPFSGAFEALKAGAVIAPRMATVFLTYGCDFSCAGCHYNAQNEAGWRFLDAGVLLRRLAELKAMGLRSVSFCGGGEPLWHRDIHAIVDGIHELGLSLGVITNGTRLLRDDRLCGTLLARNEFVRISVYEETDLDKVKALAYRDRACTLGIKLLVNARNVDFNVSALQRLADAPFDYFTFKAERQSPDALDPLDAEALADVERRLRAVSPKVWGSLGKGATTTRCYLTPIHVMIGAEGNLYLCCFFQGRQQRHCYGNIHDDVPFEEIWNGARHREARAAVSPAECSNWDCRFFKYLSAAENILADRSPVPAFEHAAFDDDLLFV